jgi:hypothetical protein
MTSLFIASVREERMANLSKTQKVSHLLKMISDRSRLDQRIQLATRQVGQLIPGYQLVPMANGQASQTGIKRGPGRPPLTLAGIPRLKPGPKPGTPRKMVSKAKGKVKGKKGPGKATPKAPANVTKDDKKGD